MGSSATRPALGSWLRKVHTNLMHDALTTGSWSMLAPCSSGWMCVAKKVPTSESALISETPGQQHGTRVARVARVRLVVPSTCEVPRQTIATHLGRVSEP